GQPLRRTSSSVGLASGQIAIARCTMCKAQTRSLQVSSRSTVCSQVLLAVAISLFSYGVHAQQPDSVGNDGRPTGTAPAVSAPANTPTADAGLKATATEATTNAPAAAAPPSQNEPASAAPVSPPPPSRSSTSTDGTVIVSPLPDAMSPLSMFLQADVVVKAVMIGLALASVATWTVLLVKMIQVRTARREARSALAAVLPPPSL